MSILPSTLGLALAAFCVWLAVWFINSRDTLARRLGVIVLIEALALYPLSFGPACWITSRFNFGAERIPRIYAPMALLIKDGPPDFSSDLQSFAELAADDNWIWQHNITEGEMNWQPRPPRIRTFGGYGIRISPTVPILDDKTESN